ncbi:MAG: hypothetical protein ABIZ70_02015 [Gemmatimonadales bacterium]
MSDLSPFNDAPDLKLGAAIRDALTLPHDGAFVSRVRARLGKRAWEDELAGWFWQGLVAASLATVLAGWGWSRGATTATTEASVASELLEGSRPGADILLVAMTSEGK